MKMNWYSQMIKSQETARERNKREQRRLQLQMFQKHGPEFAAKYRVKELNREQKIISKELDRIRKGVHKPLANEYTASSPVEKKTPFSLSAPKSKVIYTREETNFYKAMLFLQNNPSALVPVVNAHSHSNAYYETLHRMSPGVTPEPQRSFAPSYLKRSKETAIPDPTLIKYSALLYRQSPMLRKNSPIFYLKNFPLERISPTSEMVKSVSLPHRPSPLTDLQSSAFLNSDKEQIRGSEDQKKSNKTKQYQKENVGGNVLDDRKEYALTVDVHENVLSNGNPRVTGISLDLVQDSEVDIPLESQRDESDIVSSFFLTSRSGNIASAKNFQPEVISTSTPTSGRPRLDLLTLAEHGLQSARDNVVKRLASKEMASTHNKSGTERKSSVVNKYNSTENESNDNATDDNKNKPMTATKAIAMFPTYDPEVYNADGSLRKVHQLPDFEESYQQARKARYIRSKENLEKERELSIKDIFDKS